MIIEHTTPTYAKGNNEPTTLRNLSATHRTIVIQRQKESAEQTMMNFAYKIGRSEKQREERRNKR